jgi:isopenicillin-N epimerase
VGRAPEQRQHLHPTVISWGLDLGVTNEFDLLGTRDPTAHLCAPFAIDLLRSYGDGAVMAYNHELAWWTGHRLAEAWQVPFATPEEMVGSMVTVRLPSAFHGDADDARRLQAVLADRRIEVPVAATPDGFTTRVSAQIYCDRDDVERLATAVLELG